MMVLILWIGALVIFTGGFIGGFLFYAYFMQIHETESKVGNHKHGEFS